MHCTVELLNTNSILILIKVLTATAAVKSLLSFNRQRLIIKTPSPVYYVIWIFINQLLEFLHLYSSYYLIF